MQILGFIIHHSVCPSINGKGFDFFICSDATIIPATIPMDEEYIHICFEGDYSKIVDLAPANQEQLFVAQKLLVTLALLYQIDPTQLFAHTESCPGSIFPWNELVISEQDRYH